MEIKSNKIAKYMRAKALSAEDLAFKANVTAKTIYNIMRNKNTPSVTLAAAIAQILDVELNELFEFEAISYD